MNCLLKYIEIPLRSDLRIAFIFIISAFCVHIIHQPKRKKIQIPDGDAELYAAKQKQGGGHQAVSCVKFFRLHSRLDIQPPQLDNLRKHLVNGKGAELIHPLLRTIWDGRICVLRHDVGDVFEHLKREHIEVRGILIPVSHGSSKSIEVLMDFKTLDKQQTNSKQVFF